MTDVAQLPNETCNSTDEKKTKDVIISSDLNCVIKTAPVFVHLVLKHRWSH